MSETYIIEEGFRTYIYVFIPVCQNFIKDLKIEKRPKKDNFLVKKETKKDLIKQKKT